MVAFEFNALYHSILILISSLVPGIAIGWPLMKNSKLSVAEKALMSIFLGIMLVPSMLFAENLVGIKFSLPLVLANIVILTGAGIYWGYRENAFLIKMPQIDSKEILSEEFVKKHAVTLLLLIAIFLSFWIRVQTYSPIYSELDPYFYVYGSGQIITGGEVPAYDDSAWWPEVPSTHRIVPVKMYLEAMWYSLYTEGGEYDNYLIFVTSSWLPPLAGALLSFGAYLLFSAYAGKRFGLFAAFLIAFLPILMFKMSAGVNEAAPYGMAAIAMSLGTCAIAMRDKDQMVAAIAGFSLFTAITASNYMIIAAFAIAGFAGLQAVDYFLRNEKSEFFTRLMLCLLAGVLVGNLFLGIYKEALDNQFLFNSTTLFLLLGTGLAIISENAEKLNIPEKKRKAAFGALIIVGLILLVATPLGDLAKNEINDMLSRAGFNEPLERTIAEQNQAGGNFESEAGFLAYIPKNHISTEPQDAIGTGINLIIGILGFIASVSTSIANSIIGLVDWSFNTIIGTSLYTGKKEDSILFFFMLTATAGLIHRHLTRQGDDRNVPSAMLLVLLIILPLSYVGFNKVKFMIFTGLTIALAVVASFAELERFFLYLGDKLKLAKEKANIKKIFVAVMAFIVFMQVVASPLSQVSIVKSVLIKSMETKYQDAPMEIMPRLASLCEEIKKLGYNDQRICEAGSDPEYPSTINRQFEHTLCFVSQLSLQEIFPGENEGEQLASAEAKTGASYRCNKLSEYWVESMEWISKNVGEGDRITSWWDYGHWINFFGERKTVLRNEHASRGMIGRVAHDYIDGTPEQLRESMNYFDSRYALFDVELIGSDSFGGKYGALNYLSCAHDQSVSVNESPGDSLCEFEHSPERLLVPSVQTQATACLISESQQRTGIYAYSVWKGGVDTNKPAYCVGELTLPSGEIITATYYLDKKDENGDLVLSKGFMRQIAEQNGAVIVEMVYNNNPTWPGPNGTLIDGMEDASCTSPTGEGNCGMARKTKFYTSNLYMGFFLREIPGFELVYETSNGEIKIYRMIDFIGNPDGVVDPESAKKGV